MRRPIDVTGSPATTRTSSVNGIIACSKLKRGSDNEASRYLEVALAWVHTYPVRYDAITAEVELPGGELVMTADGDSLSLRLTGAGRRGVRGCQRGRSPNMSTARPDAIQGFAAF